MEEQMEEKFDWDASDFSTSTSFSEFSPRLEAVTSSISSLPSTMNSQTSDCTRDQSAVLHAKEANNVQTKKKKQKNYYRIVDANSNEDSLPSNFEISRNNESIIEEINGYCDTVIYKPNENVSLPGDNSSNLYNKLETIQEVNELSNITNNQSNMNNSSLNSLESSSSIVESQSTSSICLSLNQDCTNNEKSKNSEISDSDKHPFQVQYTASSERELPANSVVEKKELTSTGAKAKRNPRKTKTKGVQTNVKPPNAVENGMRAKKQGQRMPKNENPPEAVKNGTRAKKQSPTKENKVLNTNYREEEEAKMITEEHGQSLNEIDTNIALPNKAYKEKNKLALSECSIQEKSACINAETALVADNPENTSVTTTTKYEGNSLSYNINIMPNMDMTKQPICIQLPPNSGATVMNLNVAVVEANKTVSIADPHLIKIKQEQIPTIDLTLDDSIVIKKENVVEEKQIPSTSKIQQRRNSPAKQVKTNGKAQNKRSSNRKIVSQGTRRNNNTNKKKQPQKETLKCGYMSSTDEDTSSDSSECSCSCSECEYSSSDCDCSDCMSSS